MVKRKRPLDKSQRRITNYFAVRQSLTHVDNAQINTRLTRADTGLILSRTTKWLDMSHAEQIETVQASKSFPFHFG